MFLQQSCRRAVERRGEDIDGADIVSWSSIRSERASIECPALIFPGTEEVRTSYGAVGYRRDTSLPEWVDGLLIVGLCWHSNRYRGTEVPLRRLNYPRES